jgi:hypothetical protein
MNKAARRPPCSWSLNRSPSGQAAFNHMDVSNALLINGMFMPKLDPAALLAAGLAGFSEALGISVARSQEPSS